MTVGAVAAQVQLAFTNQGLDLRQRLAAAEQERNEAIRRANALDHTNVRLRVRQQTLISIVTAYAEQHREEVKPNDHCCCALCNETRAALAGAAEGEEKCTQDQ